MKRDLRELTKAEIRGEIIELLGEGAWLYVHYNYNIHALIEKSGSVHELAETMQDLIAQDLQHNSNPEN